ncbi:MAG: c-type cytochrome [Bdellovibrionales bacterium]
MKWWVLLFLLVGCSAEGPHKPVNGRQKSEVGFEKVRGVFAKHCSGCHPSRSPPDWLVYDQARTYADNGLLVKRVVQEKSMPPPSSAEAAQMTEEERQIIASWVAAGAPEKVVARGEVDQAGANALTQQCLQCHGKGSAKSDLPIPSLAGQTKEYLARQLRRYKWRDRIDPTDQMNKVAMSLTDDDIGKVASYYAGLAKDQPAPSAPSDMAKWQAGYQLARWTCSGCHTSGPGNGPASVWVPDLRFQSQFYLLNQLLRFRSQERKSELMRHFVEGQSPEDLEALAYYFANWKGQNP